MWKTSYFTLCKTLPFYQNSGINLTILWILELEEHKIKQDNYRMESGLWVWSSNQQQRSYHWERRDNRSRICYLSKIFSYVLSLLLTLYLVLLLFSQKYIFTCSEVLVQSMIIYWWNKWYWMSNPSHDITNIWKSSVIYIQLGSEAAVNRCFSK